MTKVCPNKDTIDECETRYYLLLAFGCLVVLISIISFLKPCYQCCQQGHPVTCFYALDYLILQFMAIRPLFFLAVAIIEETTHNARAVRVFTAAGSLSLIFGMLALLRAYHLLAEHTAPLFPTKKVLFIKGIVFVMIVQNLVVHSYQRTGLFQGDGKDLEEMDEQKFDWYRQVYATVGLSELGLLSFILNYVFNVEYEPQADDAKSELSEASDIKIWRRRRSLRPSDAPPESLMSFLCEVLSFWTIVFYTPHSDIAMLELPRVLTSVIGSSAIDSDLEEQGMELTASASE